jgi:hypothetical protein
MAHGEHLVAGGEEEEGKFVLCVSVGERNYFYLHHNCLGLCRVFTEGRNARNSNFCTERYADDKINCIEFTTEPYFGISKSSGFITFLANKMVLKQ